MAHHTEKRKAFKFGLRSQSVKPSSLNQAHSHREVELNLIETGSITYIFGGQQIILEAGELAIFWAAIPHHIIAVTEPTSMHWLTIPLTNFMQWDLPNWFAESIFSAQMVVTSSPNLAFELANIKQWQRDISSNANEKLRVMLLEIEARLWRLAFATNPQQTINKRTAVYENKPIGFRQAQQMARFMASHYTEDLSIQNITDCVKLHPNYAMGIFRKHYQMSLLAYLTQFRVAHAQRLLLVTDNLIKDIAFASGFGSISQFYATFKKVCGHSPRQYRILHGIDSI